MSTTDDSRAPRSGAAARTPPSKHTLKLLVGPVIVLIIMSQVANIMWPKWHDEHPLLLIFMSSINRYLILVSAPCEAGAADCTPPLDALPYYLVGTFRLLISDPLFFLIGYWYGDKALAWLDRKSPTYGPLIRSVQGGFGKAAWAFVLIAPNNWVCLLAGAAGMRIGTFFFFNLVGTVGRLYLIRVLGEAISSPVNGFTDFVGRYQWQFIAGSAVLVVWSMRKEFSGTGEIASMAHLDEEIEEAAAEAEAERVESERLAAEKAHSPDWQSAVARTHQPDVTRRDTEHPPLGARTPFDNAAFFDEAQLADLRTYARPIKRVRSWVRIVTYAIDAVAIFVLDLGPRIADLAPDAPWPVQLLLVMGLLSLISEVLTAPFDYWMTMVHDRRHGMSNQSVGVWLGDFAKGLVLNMVLIGFILIPVYAAIHHFDTWWLIGGVIFLALQLVLAFLAPVVLMPRFNKFEPMPEGPVRRRIEHIADLAGVTIEGVYTMDGSKRSRRGNAYVAGFGKTKRVVVFDTVMDMPLDELSQIIAHEIGHYRLNHIPKTFPFNALPAVLTLAFVQYVGGDETVLGWAGVDSGDLGDPAAAPVFLLAFSIPMTVFQIGTAWLSRRNEREADLEALELLGNPTAFVHMWPRLAELNKADLEPGPWDRLTASHPEIGERMQFGIDWATTNDVPVDPPEPAAVPEDAKAAAADDGKPDLDAAFADD